MLTANILVMLAVFAAFLLIEVMVKKQYELVTRSIGLQILCAFCILALEDVWLRNIFYPIKGIDVWAGAGFGILLMLYGILWLVRVVLWNYRRIFSKPANH